MKLRSYISDIFFRESRFSQSIETRWRRYLWLVLTNIKQMWEAKKNRVLFEMKNLRFERFVFLVCSQTKSNESKRVLVALI